MFESQTEATLEARFQSHGQQAVDILAKRNAAAAKKAALAHAKKDAVRCRRVSTQR
jgi:hypothetical protein